MPVEERSPTVTEPEEEREKTPKTDAVLHPPTANPGRTRVRPPAPGPERDEDEDEPAESPTAPREEG
jgi:hypothetical protein